MSKKTLTNKIQFISKCVNFLYREDKWNTH